MDIADQVVRFTFHEVRLRQSALGKQGRLRNDVDSMDKFAALFAKGGLSLDRLRTLCAVAEAGSLTADSDRLRGPPAWAEAETSTIAATRMILRI